MKAIGVKKAQTRLQRAQSALQRLENSNSYEDFEEAWTVLLLNLNSIHSVLEQSAKGNPRAESWFGRKKHERKKDPLLQYLHQARNTDEHGIEPVTRFEPGGLGIGATSGSMYLEGLTIKNGAVTIKGLQDTGGGQPYVDVLPPRARLVDVTNTKYGDVFRPPNEHLGEPLLDDSPLSVAKLGLRYHEGMVAEAVAFSS